MSDKDQLDKQKHEALTIMMEECSEVIKACSKIIRFGQVTNAANLAKELGQVLAMLAVLKHAGIITDEAELFAAAHEKFDSLKEFSNIPYIWLRE